MDLLCSYRSSLRTRTGQAEKFTSQAPRVHSEINLTISVYILCIYEHTPFTPKFKELACWQVPVEDGELSDPLELMICESAEHRSRDELLGVRLPSFNRDGRSHTIRPEPLSS